jgi:hypothetical protein
MNYLIHATPVHPSLCLQSFILLFTIATITAFILLLLLLFHYYHHYKTVATNKPLRASLFPSAAELTTHLLRLINILWLPLCRINKFGFYFPRRLLRSPILMGHHTHLLKAFLQHRLHGIKHATLDKGGVIHLGLVEIFNIPRGRACGHVTYSSLKYIGHLMGLIRCKRIYNF